MRKKKPSDEDIVVLANAGAVVKYTFEDGSIYRLPLVNHIVQENSQKGDLLNRKRLEAEQTEADQRARESLHRIKSGQHRPRTKKQWGIELAHHLRAQALGVSKDDLWKLIPADQAEPLVIEQGEIRAWRVYRDGDYVYAVDVIDIDTDADPNQEPETLKKSTFKKNYL